MAAAAAVQKAAEPEAKPVELSESEKHQQWLDSLDDIDLVTVIRRNWGTPGVPLDKEDYLDRITFIGGVARNVPWELARKWVKLRLIDRAHIFENNATAEQFSRATGRTPLEPGSLAAALHTLSVDKLIAILGDEQALELAKATQKRITNRRESAGEA